jgi:hypothetical protein
MVRSAIAWRCGGWRSLQIDPVKNRDNALLGVWLSSLRPATHREPFGDRCTRGARIFVFPAQTALVNGEYGA